MSGVPKGSGSRAYALGFLTTAQACEEYGTCDTALRSMREAGLLSVRTPVGQSRPLYYRRDELDMAFLGLMPAFPGGPAVAR